MENFNEIELPDALRASLTRMNFTTPTPIQALAIPLVMAGRDVLGSAQTGTGKTGAFGIPLVARMLTNPRGTALIMTPTRELAVQVMAVIKELLGPRSPINTALLIGGEPMPKQFQQLKMRPRIFVGTPGRINDHLARGTLMLHDTGFLVLDETDRMLDMGFGIQIDKILKYLPQTRQTMLFSATLPDEIISLSKKYLTNPERISVGATHKVATQVTQELIHIPQADKYTELLRQLEKRQGSVIVFVKTKFGADKLAQRLTKQGHSADAIHGDLQQRQRDRVIAGFRDMRYRILVATDIAARGLDIPHIEHVINHDLPQCPEDYIHRIGRTARAGAEGAAVSFISPDEHLKWRAIHKMLNPNEAPLPSGPRAGAPKGGRGGNRRRGFGGGNNGGGNGGQGGQRRGPAGDGAKKPFRPRRHGQGNSRPPRQSSAA